MLSISQGSCRSREQGTDMNGNKRVKNCLEVCVWDWFFVSNFTKKTLKNSKYQDVDECIHM